MGEEEPAHKSDIVGMKATIRSVYSINGTDMSFMGENKSLTFLRNLDGNEVYILNANKEIIAVVEAKQNRLAYVHL